MLIGLDDSLSSIIHVRILIIIKPSNHRTKLLLLQTIQIHLLVLKLLLLLLLLLSLLLLLQTMLFLSPLLFFQRSLLLLFDVSFFFFLISLFLLIGRFLIMRFDLRVEFSPSSSQFFSNIADSGTGTLFFNNWSMI